MDKNDLVMLSDLTLGESDHVMHLSGPSDLINATLWLTDNARRTLYVSTPNLELDRFNDGFIISAFSGFARRSRYSDLRILVADPTLAIHYGHKLVTLAQRIPDSVLIRQLHEDDIPHAKSFMVADDIGLLRRHDLETLNGTLTPKSIPHAQNHQRLFLEYWERAHSVADFRKLYM